MGTNPATNETVFPSFNDVAKVEHRGDRIEEKQSREWANMLTRSNFVDSGLTLSTAGSLVLPIAAGVGWIDGHRTEIEASTITLADNDTNHVYLQLSFDGPGNVDDVLLNANVTGVAPINSVKLGQAVTSGGVITSVIEDKQIGPKSQAGTVLIEPHTSAAAETSHSFDNLDGDTDGVYMLIGRVLLPGAGGPHLIRVDPNGGSASQSGAGFRDDGTTRTQFTAANMILAQGDNGEIVEFKAILHAEKTLNRMLVSTFSTDEPAFGQAGSRWAETATNITSLLVTGDGANKLGQDSTLLLFKLQQSLTV